MVLRLRAQVLEDRLLPEALHVVPVINHPVPNGIVHAIARRPRVRKCLIADEEVEVLDSPLRREVPGLGWDSRPAARLRCRPACRNGSGVDAV
jgi:hypothetical protein